MIIAGNIKAVSKIYRAVERAIAATGTRVFYSDILTRNEGWY